MLGLNAGLDSWLRATEENRDGPARVEGAIEREAGAVKAAVCRSRDERTADAIVSHVFSRQSIGFEIPWGGGHYSADRGSTSEDVVKRSRSVMML